MKRKIFTFMLLVAFLSNTFNTLSLSDNAQRIIDAAKIKASQMKPNNSNHINVPAETDSIVRELLFGQNHPAEHAESLLHIIIKTLKDNPGLSQTAQLRLHKIKSILEQCIIEKSSIQSWLQLQSINFEGILSKELLNDIKNKFSGLSFALRLQK